MSGAEEPEVVNGVVTDAEDEVVEGVTCILKRQSDNKVLETTTDSNGAYRFEGVYSGVYHGFVRYTDSRGNLYNAQNKHNVQVDGIDLPSIVENQRLIGDNNGNLYAIDPDGTSTPTTLWTFTDPANGQIRAGPAVSEGVVFIGTVSNNMFAINASDGTEKWSQTLTDAIYSSPVVVGDSVYVCDSDSVLSLDKTDGSENWSTSRTATVRGDPLVTGGSVYVTDQENILSLDKQDGSVEWSVAKDFIRDKNPVLVDGSIVIASNDTNVYAFDPSDGSENWSFSMDTAPQSMTVAGYNGHVYAGDDSGNVYKLDSSDGSEVWRNTTTASFVGSPLSVYDNKVYGLGDPVFALDISDGSEVWTSTDGDITSDGGVAIVDGSVIVPGAQDNAAYSLDAQTGNRNWSFSASDAVYGASIGAADGACFSGRKGVIDNKFYLPPWWK